MVLTLTVGAIPDAGPAPLAVNFSASPSGGFAPYAFLWTLGDGQTSTFQNLIHTYAHAGDYSATCKVTDSHGNTVTSGAIPITISAATPNATFTILADQVCASGIPGPLVPIPAPASEEAIPSGALENLPAGSAYDNCLGEYISTTGVPTTLTLVEGP